MARRAPTSSIEKQIDRSIAGWVKKGLVAESGWSGKPLKETPMPAGAGITFDPVAVERVLRFFLLLRQLIGRWSGREFRLFDWQVRYLVAPVFGILGPDGHRLIRTVWFEIPRKNGKSTLCSGLALYLFMADREPGAEVYAAAGSRIQAGIVFKASRNMAQGSPAIMAKLTKRGLQRALLEHPVTKSIFRSLSSNGDLQHGLNVHGAIIDEVHVHKTPDLIDALETGTGSREQPLIVFITTANDGADGSIYATKREELDALVARTISDPTKYGVVFGADPSVDGFDAFSDETIAVANPGAGLTVTWEYLRQKAVEAKGSPAQLNRYLRLCLNIRTKQTTKWLPIENWDTTGQLITPSDWSGRSAFGGLDLSSSSDFTAFALRGVNDELGHPTHVMFWLPEERLGELERRTGAPLRRWVADGWLSLTEGNVVDYAKVRSDIEDEVRTLGCTVESIGYDPWNASETVQQLEAAGFQMVPVRQGYANLSAPAKSLERMVFGSTPKKPLIRTAGNPVLRWMVDCADIRSDDNGNIKPVKPDRGKSSKRIDGVVALIMAEREAMAGTEVSSGDAYLAAILAAHSKEG